MENTHGSLPPTRHESQSQSITQTSTKNKTGYFWAGIVTAGLAVISALALVVWYKHTGYLNDKKIQDVAGAIFVPAGFFATIAGTLFVIDNLRLQREDLKMQREELELQRQEMQRLTAESHEANDHYENQTQIMRMQQAEATFFNLLNHSKELALGLPDKAVDNVYSAYEHSSDSYRHYMLRKVFPNVNNTHENPLFVLKNNSHLSGLESYFRNIGGIIDFISESFAEKDNNKREVFYHKILYENLSSHEKTLLGILIENQFFELKNPKSFKYSKTYDDNKRLFKKTEETFPMVQVTDHKPVKRISQVAALNFITQFDFIFDYCINPGTLKVISYEVKAGYPTEKTLLYQTVEEVNIEMNENDNLIIDLKPAILDLENERKGKFTGSIAIKFLMMYKNIPYTMFHTVTYNIVKFLSPDSFTLATNNRAGNEEDFFFPNR